MNPEPGGVSLRGWWNNPALSWMPDYDIVMQAGWVTAAQSQGWAYRNTNTMCIHSHSWIKHPAVSVQQTPWFGCVLQFGPLSGALSTNCLYLTFRKELLIFYTVNKYFIFLSMIHKQTFWRIFGRFAGLRAEMFPLLGSYRLTLSFRTMLFFVSSSRWYTRWALWFVSVCWHQVL